MGSRVNTSKQDAIEYANALGLPVSKEKTVDGCKVIMVGAKRVWYDPKAGGCACWQVEGVTRKAWGDKTTSIVGYVGEAIKYAADHQ